MRVTNGSLVAAIVVCGLVAFVAGARGQAPWPHPDLQQFFLITGADDDVAERAHDEIATARRDTGLRRDGLGPPAVHAAATATNLTDAARGQSRRPLSDPDGGRVEPEDPTTRVYRRLRRLLEEQAGERLGNDAGRWHQWIWQQPYDPHPEYARFKEL